MPLEVQAFSATVTFQVWYRAREYWLSSRMPFEADDLLTDARSTPTPQLVVVFLLHETHEKRALGRSAGGVLPGKGGPSAAMPAVKEVTTLSATLHR